MRVDSESLTLELVREIVAQLDDLGVRTVTLGGNEPIYTNGLSLDRSLLPEIVLALADRSIRVALVTSGPSATALRRLSPRAFAQLDMVFVSLDAPTADRHNANRGATLFPHALRALAAACDAGIDRSILYCAHSENFSVTDVEQLVELARSYDARVRVNTLKPTSQDTDGLLLEPDAYLAGFSHLVKLCRTDLVDEPVLRSLLGLDGSARCPCGTTTFRISHARPDGSIPLAPCIYAADYRVGDVRGGQLAAIVDSEEFRRFRNHPSCGCTAQSVLRRDGVGRDPVYELVVQGARIVEPNLCEDEALRDRYGGYLCTWFGSVR